MAAFGRLNKFKTADVAMVTKVQNGAKYKNPPIWAKFGFQVDYDVANCYSSLLLWCSELDETFQKFCLTGVHIILRLRNFIMARCHKKREKFKVLGIG